MKQYLIFSAATLSLILSACSGKQAKESSASAVTAQHMTTDSNAAAAPPVSEAKVALPAFMIKNMNGTTINLQSFKGKKVFVNLWASWCPPCRREMPSIEKLAKSVDKNKVAFVMLSLDEKFDNAKAFVKRQQFSVPVYYPAENLPAVFAVRSIPTTFIFDENGNLFQRIDGGEDYNSESYRQLLR